MNASRGSFESDACIVISYFLLAELFSARGASIKFNKFGCAFLCEFSRRKKQGDNYYKFTRDFT